MHKPLVYAMNNLKPMEAPNSNSVRESLMKSPQKARIIREILEVQPQKKYLEKFVLLANNDNVEPLVPLKDPRSVSYKAQQMLINSTIEDKIFRNSFD